jgi:hypothetical protein
MAEITLYLRPVAATEILSQEVAEEAEKTTGSFLISLCDLCYLL